MIIGIGVDILKNKRVEKIFNNSGVLSKFLTDFEVKQLKIHERLEHICGIFAAKEAVIKAAGVLIKNQLNFLDIVINKNFNGAPFAEFTSSRIRGKFRKIKIYLSISHERDFSVAVAILEKN